MTQSETVFIDTSAFYALIDRSDTHHGAAKSIMENLLEQNSDLSTSNYVLIETYALLQSRLGFEAANLFHTEILLVIDIQWIDQQAHNIATELWKGLGRNKLSFVDCTSFMAMRQNDIEKAFSFDKHFSEQGFELAK